MGLSYKAKRRWSLFILLVGMPIYALVAVAIMSQLDRFPIVIEFVAYVLLGIGWVFPFKRVFLGIGQPDPDAPPEED
jgi:hypothetical protein